MKMPKINSIMRAKQQQYQPEADDTSTSATSIDDGDAADVVDVVKVVEVRRVSFDSVTVAEFPIGIGHDSSPSTGGPSISIGWNDHESVIEYSVDKFEKAKRWKRPRKGRNLILTRVQRSGILHQAGFTPQQISDASAATDMAIRRRKAATRLRQLEQRKEEMYKRRSAPSLSSPSSIGVVSDSGHGNESKSTVQVSVGCESTSNGSTPSNIAAPRRDPKQIEADDDGLHLLLRKPQHEQPKDVLQKLQDSDVFYDAFETRQPSPTPSVSRDTLGLKLPSFTSGVADGLMMKMLVPASVAMPQQPSMSFPRRQSKVARSA